MGITYKQQFYNEYFSLPLSRTSYCEIFLAGLTSLFKMRKQQCFVSV